MTGRQRILPVRRDDNRWFADETLEDVAPRFTARHARRWPSSRVAQAALGALSVLASTPQDEATRRTPPLSLVERGTG